MTQDPRPVSLCPYSRVSFTRHSPTSKTTAPITSANLRQHRYQAEADQGTSRPALEASQLYNPGCLSGTRRLIGNPFRPLRDRGQITGLDQFVRLKMRERTGTGRR